MGLLNNYLTKTIPQNARNIWEAMKRAPSDLQGLVSPQMNTQVRQAMNKPAKLDRNAAMGMAMDYLQTTNPMGGLLAHTVYHGSPHKFNKFDMSKIGTGEGAQAYGHGLYFAESPGVAQSYADALSSKGHPLIAQRTQEIISKFEGNESQAKDYITKAVEHYKNKNRLGDADFWQRALDDFDSYKNYGKGQMYKVDIPDESIPRMLDWDKPLSEQGDTVRKSITEAAKISKDPWISGWAKTWEQYPNVTGQEVYRSFTNRLGNQNTQAFKSSASGVPDASEIMRQAGIPGIRYKDAMSRGTDAGTSNFVLFDDELARILEINGQPTGLLSWADEATQKTKNSIENLDNLAKERMRLYHEKNPLSVDSPMASIEFLTPQELELMYQYKKELPSYADEAQAAKKRIADRIAARKAKK